MTATANGSSEGMSGTRHHLVPCDGGYRIERVRPDLNFDPPLWVHAGWLNAGQKFASRAEARDYMRSGVER